MSGDFTSEQKRYLEGFTAGLQIARTARGAGGAAPAPEPAGPDADHLRAQDRVLKAGGTLSDQEKFKREQHPFDAHGRLKEQAATNEAPKAADNFRWRYFGLFYCAPAQSSYMCRLRIPNGILRHSQLGGLAELAERYASGYAHVTTRANLQMREVEPKNAVAMVEAIQDLGLCSRGAGIIPVLEDTNDIGFQAVAVKEGFGVAPGVWFRVMLGGITGHRDFARETGVVVRPGEATAVADAVVRVFIDHGDRTNRNRARLKYVIDNLGMEKVLALVEEKLGRKLMRVAPEALALRPAFDRTAHVGVHPQKQQGLHWIGIVLPVGRLTAAQMRGLAEIAGALGDGDIRLTVWQNLLISGVPAEKLAAAVSGIEALDLSTSASAIRAGLVACTGNVGCRFSASDTKRHAEAIARWCEARVRLDHPVNIHLTGCHHSCAQHYIGDIGLLACKVQTSEDGDTVEGYHIHVGGGFGSDAALAREIYRDVIADDAPAAVERVLKAYLAHRASPDETFLAFTRRHDVEAIKAMAHMERAT